ncbi:MAG TPA: molybdopterin-dependent oxidoreductase [Jatrophihabitans sp.]|uniref:molybdopterin-dependent oxidoreductase n=1 Tax=Jatrophihabitans sp. TaxID=1932789 RepID=UPI002E04DAF9|nr:molybdopterin-dependent oxidoreductase [Jatrophihabitans sp.]
MRSRIPVGLLIGVLVAGVAVGVGELVAFLVRPAAAPVIAVGNRVIELTPESVKRWAIRAVGTDDKLLLIGSILLLLALFGAAVGTLALRHLAFGLAGVGVLGLVGVYCALTVAAARGTDVIPTVVGTAAAMGALVALVRSATAPAEAPTAGPARRQFLQSSGAVAALALAAGVGGRLAQHARFDVAAARARVTLPPPATPQTVPVGADLGRSGVPWRTSNRDFYRIDTALSVPQIAPTDWRLRIHGLVDREITLTYDELLRRPLVDHWITLCCVSNEVGGNLVGNALFRGALLADLLREAGLHPDCDQLVMRSSDGMTIGAPTGPIMDGRAALLAVGMNGAPLPVEHGFPARVVVPGLYGYVSACKWVVDIEATRFDRFQAYWVNGGWAPNPPIRLMSRIDRPSNSESVSVGETVAIAGVAWDQHVGVSKVEVQIDDGPWRAARLATVPSTDTWRQWVYPWTPEKSGRYRLRVRATDAGGRVQDDHDRDVFPAGATGLHAVTVRAVI